MFLLKKNVKHFSFLYVSRNKATFYVVETAFPLYLENDLSYWLYV